MENQTTENQAASTDKIETKFCKHCGGKIAKDAVICTLCGRQVEEISGNNAAAPQIIVNNSNTSSNVNANTNVNNGHGYKLKNKWVALTLCILLGFFGAHKFYEGKAGLGVLYLFTCGLFGIGIIIDFITLLFKPNPYMP